MKCAVSIDTDPIDTPLILQTLNPPVRAFNGSALPVCASNPKGKAAADPEQGSIIIVVVTDAALSPDQLKRVVRRVALGMGRMGSVHGNGSGDIVIVFSTANRGADWGNSGPYNLPAPIIQQRGSGLMDPLFTATVEATEEGVLNALFAAKNTTRIDYRRAWVIPHDQVQSILAKYSRLIKK